MMLRSFRKKGISFFSFMFLSAGLSLLGPQLGVFMCLTVKQLHYPAFAFLNILRVGINRQCFVIFVEPTHVEPEDVHDFSLSEAMASSYGLIFYCRVPVGAHEIYLAELLEIESFAASFYLQNEDVAFACKNFVPL